MGLRPMVYGNFEATEITISAEANGKIFILGCGRSSLLDRIRLLGL